MPTFRRISTPLSCVQRLPTGRVDALSSETVKRRNHLWKTYEDARGDPEFYTALLPTSKTGLLSDQELAAARKDMGDAQYFSEFECDPTSPIIGAYFGQEMKDCELEGRLEPNLAIINGPVHTAWDLGNQSN